MVRILFGAGVVAVAAAAAAAAFFSAAFFSAAFFSTAFFSTAFFSAALHDSPRAACTTRALSTLVCQRCVPARGGLRCVCMRSTDPPPLLLL